MDMGALSGFHSSLWTRSYIEYWTKFSLKFHFNQNKNLKGNMGMLLVLLESSQWVGHNVGNLKISRPKVWEILTFEQFWSLRIWLNYKKMVWEGKISWVTSLHLGQWHKLHSYNWKFGAGKKMVLIPSRVLKNALSCSRSSSQFVLGGDFSIWRPQKTEVTMIRRTFFGETNGPKSPHIMRKKIL
jgi:hypothetical protein